MLRDKNLIPLSHQHQHALALCVRIDRATQAGAVELEPWLREIEQIVEQELAIHFQAEENGIFPIAAKFAEMKLLVEELLGEHAVLRGYFAKAASRELDQDGLRRLSTTLAAHIRKEERQLFEGMQQLLQPEEMRRLGTALEEALRNASQACLLPSEATRLRPRTPK